MGGDPYRRYMRRYQRQMRRAMRGPHGGYPMPMPMPMPGEPLGFLVLAALVRWCYRHRSALRPFLIAMAAFIAAATGHAHHRVWWIPAVIITALVTMTLGMPRGWLRRWRAGRRVAVLLTRFWAACGIDRPEERGYLAVVTAVTGGWVTAAILAGPARKPVLTAELLATVVLAIPWWAHRGRRSKVRIERIIADWPGHGDHMGLPGSQIASAVMDRWGWTGRLALRKGTTAAQAIDKIPAIESVLGVPPGTVRVTPDNTRADRAVVRVIETNPHASPIPWPGPVITSITQPVTLGLFEDGQPVGISLLRCNILVGGTTGSGKSGVLNALLAILTACTDVVIWGVDLKGGMELGAWAACLGRPLATTPQAATALFGDAVTLIEDRAARMAAQGSRVWEPSPADPAVLIIVDEYAELPPPAQDHADSAARRGRAVAVSLLAATQRPTQAAMGNNAVRSQMDIRICLRVREPRDTDLILGQGSLTSGWRPHTITQPGVFLISSPQHTTPERALAYWLDDSQISRHAAQHAPGRPALPIPASPTGPAPPQPAAGRWPHVPVRWPHNTQPSPGHSDGPGGPDAALWAALTTAGPQGAPAAELLRVSGMSRATLYRRLRALAQAGQAIQTSPGHWRATGPPGGGPDGQPRPGPPTRPGPPPPAVTDSNS